MMTMEEAAKMAKTLYRLQKQMNVKKQLFDADLAELEQEKQDIINQFMNATKMLVDDIIYYQEELIKFQQAHFEETGEKTLRLPYATLTARKQPQKFDTTGELLPWVQQNAAEYIEPSVKWGELKKQIEVVNGKAVFVPTGEIMDGVIPQPVEIRYSVKPMEAAE